MARQYVKFSSTIQKHPPDFYIVNAACCTVGR